MPRRVKELMKLIEADGWVLVRIRGSHRQFHHATKPGTVTIAGKDSAELPPKRNAAFCVKQVWTRT
jgi:predicted RNA binding protein YcfA (HicA-like mRNA interferase family)